MKKLILLLCLFSIAAFAQNTTINGRKDGFNCVVAVSTATTLTSGSKTIQIQGFYGESE